MLPPRIRRVVGRRGVPRRVVQLRLRAWRRQFRLTRLWARDLGRRTRVRARANPEGPVEGLTDFEPEKDDALMLRLRRHIHETFEEILARASVRAESDAILASGRTRPVTAAELAELPRPQWNSGIADAATRHGAQEYVVPAGTTEAGLASAFRRLPNPSIAGGPHPERDRDNLLSILQFQSSRSSVYLRHRAPSPRRRHRERVVYGQVIEDGRARARPLTYGGQPHSPAGASRALGRRGRRTALSGQNTALAAIMFGQEPTRSTSAFAHALFASDVDAFSQRNPRDPAAVTRERLLGERRFSRRGRPYSGPGLAPFTGTGAPGGMQGLDDVLSGRRRLTQRLRQHLIRETEMLIAWLRTLPDLVVMEFADHEARVREIERRITIRLERSARRSGR